MAHCETCGESKSTHHLQIVVASHHNKHVWSRANVVPLKVLRPQATTHSGSHWLHIALQCFQDSYGFLPQLMEATPGCNTPICIVIFNTHQVSP